MLLLGGAATVEALTGMNYELASFLIPWGVILYTSAGGLKATFMASYLHTMIIFAVLITMITIVYIKVRHGTNFLSQSLLRQYNLTPTNAMAPRFTRPMTFMTSLIRLSHTQRSSAKASFLLF